MELTPFAAAVTAPCPTHAGLALALSAEFCAPRLEAHTALDELAVELLPVAHGSPAEQLAACAELASARLQSSDLTWAGIHDLLLDRVVIGGAGHPLALAVACVEAGRRAGIELGIVAGSAGCFVAHPHLHEPLLVDVASGRLIEATGRSADAGWQCSHQTAARLLNRIAERADRTGNVAWALRAAELRLELPFARPVLDELRHRLAHLRARLN